MLTITILVNSASRSSCNRGGDRAYQSIVMLHSNYYDSFLSNPKTWQRSILLDVSRAKKWSVLPRLVVHCPWLTIMLYVQDFFHEFCAPRHRAVMPPLPHLFSLPMPVCTLHCIHDCSYFCKHIRQNWVTVAIISTAQLQLCVPMKQSRLCTQKTYSSKMRVDNQGMCQINAIYIATSQAKAILSFDTLVLEISLRLWSSCGTGRSFKVKGSSLWTAYYSLDFARVADNGREGEQIMPLLENKDLTRKSKHAVKAFCTIKLYTSLTTYLHACTAALNKNFLFAFLL